MDARKLSPSCTSASLKDSFGGRGECIGGSC